MLFRQLFDHESSTYSYLLADEGTREALLIDPVLEQVNRDVRLIEELGLVLVATVETHVHADHVTGASQIRQALGSQIAVPAAAGVACADVELHDREELPFGRFALRAIATPGHTSGCMSYLVGAMVFTGDALLIRSCGRTDFQSGDAGKLYDSVTGRLFALPSSTVVYPAHDYRGFTSSTIGEETRLNERLARRSREDFIELMANLHLPLPKKIHEAVPANMACGLPQHAAHAGA